MKTQRERMTNGDIYYPGSGDSELRHLFMESRRLMREYNQTSENEAEKRKEMLKKWLGKTGDNIYIEPNFKCDYGFNISVGEKFYANFDCIMLDVCPITIGDYTMFGPRVSLLTASHPIDAEIRTSGLEIGSPIRIGNQVWLGGGVIVNPGVTIGDNCVIGSGSVVTKDIPANTIAAGNPCRVIRDITEEDKKYWAEKAQIYWDEVKSQK